MKYLLALRFVCIRENCPLCLEYCLSPTACGLQPWAKLLKTSGTIFFNTNFPARKKKIIQLNPLFRSPKGNGEKFEIPVTEEA